MKRLRKPEMDVEVRNKTLVKLVETLGGVIENRHTSIRTMIDEMKDAKLPEMTIPDKPTSRNQKYISM